MTKGVCDTDVAVINIRMSNEHYAVYLTNKSCHFELRPPADSKYTFLLHRDGQEKSIIKTTSALIDLGSKKDTSAICCSIAVAHNIRKHASSAHGFLASLEMTKGVCNTDVAVINTRMSACACRFQVHIFIA